MKNFFLLLAMIYCHSTFAQSPESFMQKVQENYTPEKEAAIVARGGIVRFEDFWMVYPLKAEPLGIEQLFSVYLHTRSWEGRLHK